MLLYAGLVFFAPNLLGEPVNYVPANPLATPAHIVPEWYLLPFYAVLRSVPNKVFGVLLMLGAIVTLFLVPWLDTSKVRSARFRPLYRPFFWFLVIDVLALGWVGAQLPEGPPVLIGRIATIYYYVHFWIVLPALGLVETPSALPESISKSVLGGSQPAAAHAAPETR
jgi:ubiquinol-cytochrome c reductase cytochrome b subunit